MLNTKLTPREILLLDGKLIIPVAARQLQRLLNTLSDYKKKAEKADNHCRQLEIDNIKLQEQLDELKSTVISLRCTAVNLDLSDI